MNSRPSKTYRSPLSRSALLIGLAAVCLATPSAAWSAKVPRAVLESFFQKGDKPTQAQFSALIDSLIHGIDDRDLIGLKAASDGGGDRFSEGALIGPHLTFTGAEGLSDVWAGQSGFLPLAFEEDSQVHYGYLQIAAGDPGSADVYPMFVEYFVYEDLPGVPIDTQTVPEPSSLVLAAAGLAVLAAGRWRRRVRAL